MTQADKVQIDHTLLEDLPFGLLLLGPDARTVWINNKAAELIGAPSAELRDRPASEISLAGQPLPETEHRLLYDEDSGHWLRCDVFVDGGDNRLVVLTDVSAQEKLAEENARLQQRVHDLQLTDELTGLPNKRAISQALDLHISRSRRYENPLSIVLVHVDMHPIADVQPLSVNPVVLSVSRFLRDRLRWVDQIARWDDQVFLLVLPETDEADARGLLKKVDNEQEHLRLPASFGALHPQLTFGMACWCKGDDIRTLLGKALQDLRETSGT